MNLEQFAKFFSHKNQANLEMMASRVSNSTDTAKARAEYESDLKRMIDTNMTVEELEKQKEDGRNQIRK